MNSFDLQPSKLKILEIISLSIIYAVTACMELESVVGKI